MKMKYLIFSVVGLTVGMCVSAAAVSWKSGTVKGVDTANGGVFSSSNIGKENAEGQLYYISGEEYSNWFNALSGASTLVDQQKQMNELYEGLSNGKIGTGAVGSPVLSSALSRVEVSDPTIYSGMTEDTPINAYAAMVYTTKVGDEKYVIANVGNIYMTADIDTSLTAIATTFGGANGSTAIKGWAAVSAPEPTSGLLLLLGMAGLALRRRRV